MMRFVVFLKLCVMASAMVPEHVMEMFENETLAVNETNETIVLILTPPTGPTYTGTPTTLEPTFAPSEAGDTSAPTTLAPTPAPAPKAKVEVTVQLASAGDFNLDSFVQALSADGDVTDATFAVTYTLELSMTINADSLSVEDVTSSMATLLGVDASIVTVVIARRLSDRRLAANQVTATAESADASTIDAAKDKADTDIDPASVVSALQDISTAYASATVQDIVPAAIEAKVEIVQTATDETAGSTLADSIASSVQALSPASFGATGMDQPITSVTIETAFPTMEPTMGPTAPTASPPTTADNTTNTSAPTAEPEEESGATLERAGLLSVAMVVLTTVVGMQ